MKLLITGGAGFIGSNFVHYWLKNHPADEITNLDSLTYAGNLENLKDLGQSKKHIFVKGDITNVDLVKTLVEANDVIVHFAAESHVDRSIMDAGVFVKTNVLGTQILLQAAKDFNKRFHQVSTDEVYGQLPLAGKEKFSESSPYQPRNPYAASKAASDHLVRSFYHTHGLAATISNTGNNFGPYQFPEKIIPLFITNLLENKKVPLYADGMNVRDWLYVIDNCEAIDLILHKGEAGQIYNIGGGNEITNLELTHAILGLLGKDKGLIKFVKDRPGHDKRYALDITKIKSLGWQPRHDFRSALKLTVGWYNNNRAWWKRLVRCRKDIRY